MFCMVHETMIHQCEIYEDSLYVFCFARYDNHRDLHVLTHSFPPRRSSKLGKPGNWPPRPTSTKMVLSPLRSTRTLRAQSNMSGPTNISLNHSARTAGSTLVAIVSVGSGSTPSLTTSTSMSPIRSA